jgi:hypothetical protein
MGELSKLVIGLIFVGLIFYGLTTFLGGAIDSYGLDNNLNVTTLDDAFGNVSTTGKVTNISKSLESGSSGWLNGTFLGDAWYSWQDSAFYRIGDSLRAASNTYDTAGDMITATGETAGVDPRFTNAFVIAVTFAILLLIAGLLFKRKL